MFLHNRETQASQLVQATEALVDDADERYTRVNLYSDSAGRHFVNEGEGLPWPESETKMGGQRNGFDTTTGMPMEFMEKWQPLMALHAYKAMKKKGDTSAQEKVSKFTTIMERACGQHPPLGENDATNRAIFWPEPEQMEVDELSNQAQVRGQSLLPSQSTDLRPNDADFWTRYGGQWADFDEAPAEDNAQSEAGSESDHAAVSGDSDGVSFNLSGEAANMRHEQGGLNQSNAPPNQGASDGGVSLTRDDPEPDQYP